MTTQAGSFQHDAGQDTATVKLRWLFIRQNLHITDTTLTLSFTVSSHLIMITINPLDCAQTSANDKMSTKTGSGFKSGSLSDRSQHVVDLLPFWHQSLCQVS